jgi:transcriptional regulator with XRE-family HTH domain
MGESKFKDIGLQLRAVRERLRMTLDDIKEQTGISRSYVSDFERGVRLPTSKYLRYLHDRHDINLNFVFCSEGRMLRMSEEEKGRLDFGKYQEEVNEMLGLISKMPHALYAVLGFFMEYKINNEKLITNFLGSATPAASRSD